MEDGEGFEPSVRSHAQRFSKPSYSTALATIHFIDKTSNSIFNSYIGKSIFLFFKST